VNYEFGWMKVVFDGRVMIGVMFRIDLVKELIVLVKI
jgi:hypothetical protein